MMAGKIEIMRVKPLAPSPAKQLLSQTHLLKVNKKCYVPVFTEFTVWFVSYIT